MKLSDQLDREVHNPPFSSNLTAENLKIERSLATHLSCVLQMRPSLLRRHWSLKCFVGRGRRMRGTIAYCISTSASAIT